MAMQQTQIEIVKLLIKRLERKPIDSFSVMDKQNLCVLLFLNQHTLQLTFHGFKVFSKCFKSYKIPFPTGYIFRSKDLIILDRECTLPYYVNVTKKDYTNHKSNDCLVLFENELATLLKLCDGDLEMVVGALAR